MVRQREMVHLSLFWVTSSGCSSYLINCIMFLRTSVGQLSRRQKPLRDIGLYGGATTFVSKNF